MNRDFLYLLGGPGAGKSTLLREFSSKVAGGRMFLLRPISHILYRSQPPVIEIGADREAFSGTDALPLNVQPAASVWLRSQATELFGNELWMAEGDRLANESFFDMLMGEGYRLQLVYLFTPQDIAADWRAMRAEKMDIGLQNPVWVRGRFTKHESLAIKYGATVISTLSLEERVLALRGMNNPVIQALEGTA